MKTQSIQEKKAEVLFRRDLFKHRVLELSVFDDEFDRQTMVRIFKKNMVDTIEDVKRLPEFKQFHFALEIGAECCQRAVAVQDQLGIKCYAVDISFESLRSIENYADDLDVHSLPRRICCDATFLPFASQSCHLAYSYQTLHHFHDPTSVIKEISRVTQKVYLGVEEPTRRLVRFWIGKHKKGMYHPSMLNRGPLRRFFDATFYERCCNEIRYGVIENNDISLNSWKHMLNLFFESEWFCGRSIHPRNRMFFDMWHRIQWLLTYELTGNVISWIARPKIKVSEKQILEPVLICPDCLAKSRGENPLLIDMGYLECSCCGEVYPVVDNIYMLLPVELRHSLYPDFKCDKGSKT